MKPEMPKPRGRPRVDEPGSRVSTWMTVGEHDRLIALAKQQDQSVSKTLRDLVILRLK